MSAGCLGPTSQDSSLIVSGPIVRDFAPAPPSIGFVLSHPPSQEGGASKEICCPPPPHGAVRAVNVEGSSHTPLEGRHVCGRHLGRAWSFANHVHAWPPVVSDGHTGESSNETG